MICVIETASRIALFLGDAITYQDGILTGPGWQFVPPHSVTLVEVDGSPQMGFIGGAWRLSEAGAWEVHDQALLDVALAAGTPDLSAMRASKLAAVATLRYERETGGAIIGGVAVRTDRESQALLTGAAVAAMLDAGYTVAWKAVSGWVTLGATDIIGLASAVRAHVQACFDRERILSLEIEGASTVMDVEAVDITSGWPA